MVSVNTSASSAAAISSLRNISKLMEQTQTRIATGLKVSSASDDPSVWAAATKLRSESSAQASLSAGINKAQGQAQGTAVILDSITDILGKMRNVVASGSNASADFTALNNQISAYQDQIKTMVAAGTVNGSNILNAAAGTLTAAVTIDSAGAAVNANVATQLAYLSTATNNARGFLEAVVEDLPTLDNTNVATLTATIDTAIASTTAYAVKLSSYANTLDVQKDLQVKLEDIRQKAIGSLVDADMEKESARVSALQVQQQLAYQALSISNGAAQNILRLFQ